MVLKGILCNPTVHAMMPLYVSSKITELGVGERKRLQRGKRVFDNSRTH
jgi:hypothetical protein